MYPTSTGSAWVGPGVLNIQHWMDTHLSLSTQGWSLLMLGCGRGAGLGVRAQVRAWLVTSELYNLCPLCHFLGLGLLSEVQGCGIAVDHLLREEPLGELWRSLLDAQDPAMPCLFPPCCPLSFSCLLQDPTFQSLGISMDIPTSWLCPLVIFFVCF